jgi:transposase
MAWTSVADRKPAAGYSFAQGHQLHLEKSAELKVFLENPDVPLDTYYLERALRPIPMGRRN